MGNKRRTSSEYGQGRNVNKLVNNFICQIVAFSEISYTFALNLKKMCVCVKENPKIPVLDLRIFSLYTGLYLSVLLVVMHLPVVLHILHIGFCICDLLVELSLHLLLCQAL